MFFLQLLQNKKIFFIIALVALLVYISILNFRISSLKNELYEKTLDNIILKQNTEQMSAALQSQNDAINEMHQKLDEKNEELKSTVDELNQQYDEKLKLLETQYNDISINDSEQAIQWLRNRKYSFK